MSFSDLKRRLLAAARRSHEDEEGSSMVFGAITLFTLALFTMTVWIVGMNSGDRLQNQTAADSAAYSGALVEAESLESIAFLNDGMASVYYTECRYAVDAIVYSTLEAFYRHDSWVNDKQPNRAQNQVGGPGIQIEYSVGPQHNNPGARPGQNYTPGVEPGGPMMSFDGNPPQPQDYGFVMMGDSGGGDRSRLFEERFQNAMGRAQQLLPRGKRWLTDMSVAERVILYATPQLVTKTCVKVATDNGAEWVAVSSDLDDVFALVSDRSRPSAGFTDGSEDNANQMDWSFTRRYGNRDDSVKSNPIDKVNRKLPSWFDALVGNIGTNYYQVRLCWNKRDWDHCEVQGQGGRYSDHMGYPFSSGAPAGHWHVTHVHGIERLDPQSGGVDGTDYVYGEPTGNGGPWNHDYGHGIQSGPDAGEHSTPSDKYLSGGYNSAIENGWARFSQQESSDSGAEHHMAQTCPTCGANQITSQWAEVAHDFNGDGKWAIQQVGLDPDSLTTVHWQNGDMPRPIFLKAGALRAGVSVATWRHSRGFTPQHLPSNDFGCFAIATAQVGLRDPIENRIAVPQSVDQKQALFVYSNGTPRTVTLATQGPNGSDHGVDNLYIGSGEQGDPGLRFGARLVPVARELSWAGANAASGGAASKGIQDLLYGQRWFDSVPNGAVKGKSASGDLQTSLDNLRNFLAVGNSVKAFAQ